MHSTFRDYTFYLTMSSGYGIRGGIGRCYPFFADYRECVAEKENTATGNVCKLIREDYFECLHHRKEHDMVRKVNEQQKLNEKLAAGGDGH